MFGEEQQTLETVHADHIHSHPLSRLTRVSHERREVDGATYLRMPDRRALMYHDASLAFEVLNQLFC
jgi:hypothetical protein